MIIRKPVFQFLIFALLVLVLQPFKVGFEPGHHGWVSAHTLAQISNATPDNFFLGFTQKTIVDGKIDYFYFDRYPFFFAGGMNLLLSMFRDHLDLTIFMGRELMNIIFLLITFFVWRITRLLFNDENKASIVTAFVVSSSLLVKYKDMVHFDQPALVGCLWVLNGILEYEIHGKKRLLIAGSLLGPLMGRGYAVIFFLAGWVLVKFVREFFRTRKILPMIRSLPALCLVGSVPIPALFLVNNIMTEAKIRNVEWIDTSIVFSARHRLGMANYKSSDLKEKKFSWGSYVSNQLQRTMDYFTPYSIYGIHVKNYKKKLLHYSSLIPKALFQLFLLYLFIKFFPPWWRSQEIRTKDHFLYLISGGVLWLIVMRNLANYHEYVTLYLIGAVILCWSFLVDWASSRTKKLKPIAMASVLLSLLMHSGWGWYEAGKVNWQSREFQRIRQELTAIGSERVYLTPDVNKFFLEGVKWGDSFFLSGFIITHDPRDAKKQIVQAETQSGIALELREPKL